MRCEPVRFPDGSSAIVCSSGRRQRCSCGRLAVLLCDWRVPERRSGTCDAPICRTCAISPARGKDLCPEHARAFEAWKAARREGGKQ